jgi:hypothetical protein
MKNTNKMIVVEIGMAILVASGLFSGCAGPSMPLPRDQSAGAPPDGPDWENVSLNMMIDKYGSPDIVESNRVVWEKKGPWKRMVVWDDMGVGLGHGQMRKPTDGNLEEVLEYLVPENKRRAVEDFSERLKVSEDGALISARSFSEERNFLALNLADEIIRGVKTPEEAKAFDAATLQLADAGKPSPYMKRLLFRAPPLPSTSQMIKLEEALALPESRR